VKVYLDDQREPPDDSWVLVGTPSEAIALLRTGRVEAISLDHDLGLLDSEYEASGYDVLLWIEQQAVNPESPELQAALRILARDRAIDQHTSNSAARRRMQLAIAAIERRFDELPQNL
jgi:hypothetical protein